MTNKKQLKALIKEAVQDELKEIRKRKPGNFLSGDIMIAMMQAGLHRRPLADEEYPDDPDMNFAFRRGFKAAVDAFWKELNELD